MSGQTLDYSLLVMMTGFLVVVAMLLKILLESLKIPALIGYLGLGLALRLGDHHGDWLSAEALEILHFLAEVGLFTLLFRIGLESNLGGLLSQLKRASAIWVADVLVSGTLGYGVAVYLLDLPWLTGMVVAAAMTATSVGISVQVWESSGALKTPEGELLLDLAELDDISAVILMALLFALLPVLHQGGAENLLLLAGQTSLLFLVKLIGFASVCLLFGYYLEKPTTRFLAREPPPDPMVTIAGVGLIFAALSAQLGFSLAIGAFFAGLVFSHDPQAVKMESSFLSLYALFSPFFFIGIGLSLDVTALGDALWPGLILFATAVLGKVLADGLPAYFLQGRAAAILIGASMVPRAEITLVVMQQGQRLGDWAVPPRVFGAMILVSALSCLLSPMTVHRLLQNFGSTGKSSR